MKKAPIIRYLIICLTAVFFSCEKNEPGDTLREGFLSFSSSGQTILDAAINFSRQQVTFEVEPDADITRLVPEFTVPPGLTVYLNGSEQVSGNSVVDFSQPVRYELKNTIGQTAEWNAEAVPVSKRIVIDASHDGGVWWFPQYEYTGFDQGKAHQGKKFADMLREKGFRVDELGRDAELKEEHFFGYFIVIRVNGFQSYTPKELDVYTKLVKRGMNMVFFTDHKKNDREDELGDLLGLKFEGVANGTISKFSKHMITDNLKDLNYIAGSVLTNADQNPDIEILGWLGEDEYADLNFNGVRDASEQVAPPVMGILNYPKSKVFFIGDTNGLEEMPQPFIDNLIEWMRK